MKIPDEVEKLFNKEPIVAFATADKEGNPNVVPIYWKTTFNDETILLLDNFMKQTKQNIQENKKVCVSFWNMDTGEAYKLKGTATYYSEGAIYKKGKQFMQSKRPGQAPKGIVEIRVEEIYTIKSGPGAGKKLRVKQEKGEE